MAVALNPETKGASAFTFNKRLRPEDSTSQMASGSGIKKPSARLALTPTKVKGSMSLARTLSSSSQDAEARFGPESTETSLCLDASKRKFVKSDFAARTEVRNLRQHFERLIAQKDKRVEALSREVKDALKRGDSMPYLDPEDDSNFKNFHSYVAIAEKSRHWPQRALTSAPSRSLPTSPTGSGVRAPKVGMCSLSAKRVPRRPRVVQVSLGNSLPSSDLVSPVSSHGSESYADLLEPLVLFVEEHGLPSEQRHRARAPQSRCRTLLRSGARALLLSTVAAVVGSHIMTLHEAEVAEVEQALLGARAYAETSEREIRVLVAENKSLAARLAAIRAQYEVEVQSLEAKLHGETAAACGLAAEELTVASATQAQSDALLKQRHSEDLQQAASLLAQDLQERAATAEQRADEIRLETDAEAVADEAAALIEQAEVLRKLEYRPTTYGLIGDALAVLVASWAFYQHRA